MFQLKKLYTIQELVTMETSIADFHTSFLNCSNQKLEFHPPHKHILGKQHCVSRHHKSFNRFRSLQDILGHYDSAKRVVACFDHELQTEYYGGNKYVSIERIALEHFSATTQP